ncbi:hypothetical protein PoB_001878300 [Plakobranchus ocellatus]|uniref:Uncharacterized protein n=1 Tax=Plakobranchus ocellatus TaxID=259542 RepID=A0AAV3ZCH2_9GAST|nr:hypothetical protein PoB_001878300 [Plakobranchus ocellatus]
MKRHSNSKPNYHRSVFNEHKANPQITKRFEKGAYFLKNFSKAKFRVKIFESLHILTRSQETPWSYRYIHDEDEESRDESYQFPSHNSRTVRAPKAGLWWHNASELCRNTTHLWVHQTSGIHQEDELAHTTNRLLHFLVLSLDDAVEFLDKFD